MLQNFPIFASESCKQHILWRFKAEWVFLEDSFNEYYSWCKIIIIFLYFKLYLFFKTWKTENLNQKLGSVLLRYLRMVIQWDSHKCFDIYAVNA